MAKLRSLTHRILTAATFGLLLTGCSSGKQAGMPVLPDTDGEEGVSASEGAQNITEAIMPTANAKHLKKSFNNVQSSKSVQSTKPIHSPTGGQSSKSLASTASKFKDGSYTAKGTYISPAGPENISVVLTLKGGSITDAVFSGSSTNGKSQQYMDMFASGFKTYVVGKKIDALALTVVNGSSLTPKGFMESVKKIKGEAAKG